MTSEEKWKNNLWWNMPKLDQMGHDPLEDEHPHCGTPDCCGECDTSTKKDSEKS